MEKLNGNRIGLTLAIVSGTVYIACALLVAIFPAQMLVIGDNLFHGIDISSIAKTPVPLNETIVGLVEIVILGYLIGIWFATVYNYLQEK